MREIELKSSRLLERLQVGMAVFALLAVWLAALPAGLQLGGSAAVVAMAIVGCRREELRTRLRQVDDGGLQGLDDAGEWRDIEVLGDSFASPALIVLRYRQAGGVVRSLIVLPDSASAEDLRRLRVSLRWGRRTRSDTSSPGAG